MDGIDEKGLLTGSSGFVGEGVHINAPYSANGKCFVYSGEDDFGWESVDIKEATEKKLTMISCCQCGKPATQVDHAHPHYCGMTLCDTCEYDPEVNE